MDQKYLSLSNPFQCKSKSWQQKWNKILMCVLSSIFSHSLAITFVTITWKEIYCESMKGKSKSLTYNLSVINLWLFSVIFRCKIYVKNLVLISFWSTSLIYKCHNAFLLTAYIYQHPHQMHNDVSLTLYTLQPNSTSFSARLGWPAHPILLFLQCLVHLPLNSWQNS